MSWLDRMRKIDKARKALEMTHKQFVPPVNPIGDAAVAWGRGVKERTLHPLETLGNEAQRWIDMPAEKMLTEVGDRINPVAGGLVGMFAGKGAKTANLAMLAKAEDLAKKGVPDEVIWKETGWTLGFPDKKPRFEIPDNAAMYRGSKAAGSSYAEDVIPHPELYQQYPSAGSIRIQEVPKSIGGNYSDIGRETITLGNRDASSIALHELQHAIQQREGFARGGSPDQMASEWARAKQKMDFDTSVSTLVREAVTTQGGSLDNAAKELNNLGIEITPEHIQAAMQRGEKQALQMGDESQKMLTSQFGKISPYGGDAGMQLYKRLAGEAEARLTQSRMAMTPEQRLANYPVSQFDVPASEQLVRYGK